MINRLPAPVRKVTDGFKAFTPGQKSVTIVAVLALAIGGYFFATWAAKPTYATLFNNLSAKDASAIVETLQKSGTPYELANSGQTILVPKEQVYDLRLQLSGEGLPGESDTGYALLDKQGVTTSDFMQHVGYQRALEGELANTIKSIDGVQAATVHLVIPQKDVFADDQKKPTASVLVTSKANDQLNNQQVQSVVHLVASSVEGLQPEQVTVADANGRMLSTGNGTAIGTGNGGDGSDDQTVTFQNRLNSSLQTMLDAVVGPGHAKVTTNAQLDFDQTQTKKETYQADPSLPALAESISREAYNGAGTNTGGVLGPDNIQVPNGANNGNGQYENTAQTRNNALNKTIEDRKSAPGTVKRLSVAVLLDSKTAGLVNPADVQQLVSAAAGVDATRGDTIAVSAMPFDTTAADQAKQEMLAIEAAKKADEQMSMLKTGGLVLLVLLLLLAVWWRGRRIKKRKALTAAEIAHLEAMQAALEQQRLAELNAAIPQPAIESTHNEHLEERQREIEKMVEQQPEEIAALLRGWLGAGR
ncbi:flagellar M-ring protein FliF [Krasilnikovia cinnamomea]|uniref:Flagellar M-ring protein n=1 Tax=Krasilnikovia cinnamomea TaxID=349313 RepID=A0A4Q7ZJM9_9ACTN|nr:flagellar basal-body MS-ring/collar protein FliF [Krasilnikovia cinnamomea]RZU50455.1 flagellar M-ring protein FliF [Krasilnikovia cinnamomea]